MLPVETMDTALLPRSDRFGFWHDIISRASVPMRVRSDHQADFRAEARVVGLGDVVLSSWRYPSLDMHRTGKLIQRGDPEMYELALPLSGHGGVTLERGANDLLAGHFTVIDTSRPHMSTHRPRAEDPGHLTTLTVLVPHALIPLKPNKVAQLLGMNIPADQGMAALLGQLVRQIMDYPEQFSEGDAPRLDTVARNLISATLAQRLDIVDTLPGEVRGQALTLRIKAFIERHLDDPNLTPAVVADAHHISLRTLQRLFQSEDVTVAEMIRVRRLDRCAQDLRDPLLRARPIHGIAARWGFSDKSHFSRLFTVTYGVSPQAFRNASTTDCGHPAIPIRQRPERRQPMRERTR